MPQKSTSFILTLSLLFIITNFGMAQNGSPSSKNILNNWQVNYNLGFTQFYGDASNNGYFKKLSGEIAFGTGFTVRKYFNQSFGLGINFLYAGLKSHKDKRATGANANVHLKGQYLDFNLNLLVDFNNLFWGPSDRKFSVYSILGIGIANWNSQLTDSLSGLVLNTGDQIGGITYKNIGAVVPFGMGVNYNINKNWALNFEIILRTVLNDDVDVWRDGFKYDQPLYTNFGISYFFNRQISAKKSRNKVQKPVRYSQPVNPSVGIYDYNLRNISNSGGTGSENKMITTPKEVKSVVNTGVEYRVQILAKSKNPPSPEELKSKYGLSGEVILNHQDGVYRFSTGRFSTYKKALAYSFVIRDKGIHDAFVVAYDNDKRILITKEMKQ